MEQFVRDARIAMIYEGANGVQAMDLVGRKLAATRAARRSRRSSRWSTTSAPAAKADPSTAAIAERARQGERRAQGRDDVVHAERHGQPEQRRRGRASLHAHHRDRRARADVAADGQGRAPRRWRAAREDAAFYEAKLVTARYFAERFMPDAGALRRKIEGGRRGADGASGGGVRDRLSRDQRVR